MGSYRLYHGTRSTLAERIRSEGFKPVDVDAVSREICERYSIGIERLDASVLDWRRRDGHTHFTDRLSLAVSYARRSPEFAVLLLERVWVLIGGTSGCGRPGFRPDCPCGRCSWISQQLESEGHPVVIHVDVPEDLIGDLPPSLAEAVGSAVADLMWPGEGTARFGDLPLRLNGLHNRYTIVAVTDAAQR